MTRKNSLRLRTKGVMKKAKKKAVSVGSVGMDTALVGSHVHGRTQSLAKLAARRASLVQDPKQNVRRSVSGGSAADEMAAAVAAMDMEERAERETEMKAAAMPPPSTTALTEGERAFVEAMAEKHGDGTGGGFKKMAKDTDINATNVSASVRALPQDHRKRARCVNKGGGRRQRPAEMTNTRVVAVVLTT
jgi:hypothetical protein